MTVKRKHLIANFEARSVLLIAGWTLGAAGAAMAQNMPPPAQGTAPASSGKAINAAFAQADKNSDGQLSRDEATALPSVAANADQVDDNGDGRISADEFKKAMKM